MQRIKYTLPNVPQMIGLALSVALVIALVWAATAQAQSPTEDQYGGRAAPSALASAGGSAGGGGGSAGGGGGSAGGGSQPAASSSPGVLPATGGPILLVYAGALVASSVGLVLLRHSGRGR